MTFQITNPNTDDGNKDNKTLIYGMIDLGGGLLIIGIIIYCIIYRSKAKNFKQILEIIIHH